MREALAQARLAADRDEVPIGAVLVDRISGAIVAAAGNSTRQLCDPSAHAEIETIRRRCRDTGAQRIPDHDLFVTLEPCPMCAAAISYARIARVVFGAADPKSGGLLQGPTLYMHNQLHHKPDVVSGVLADECGQLLTQFFAAKRQKETRT